MSKSPSPVLRQLRDGEFMSVDATVWLSVVRGRVWITQAGDPADHFLDGGQAMRLAAGVRALVGAEGAAEIALASAPSLLDALRAAFLRWAAKVGQGRRRVRGMPAFRGGP